MHTFENIISSITKRDLNKLKKQNAINNTNKKIALNKGRIPKKDPGVFLYLS